MLQYLLFIVFFSMQETLSKYEEGVVITNEVCLINLLTIGI